MKNSMILGPNTTPSDSMESDKTDVIIFDVHTWTYSSHCDTNSILVFNKPIIFKLQPLSKRKSYRYSYPDFYNDYVKDVIRVCETIHNHRKCTFELHFVDEYHTDDLRLVTNHFSNCSCTVSVAMKVDDDSYTKSIEVRNYDITGEVTTRKETYIAQSSSEFKNLIHRGFVINMSKETVMEDAKDILNEWGFTFNEESYSGLTWHGSIDDGDSCESITARIISKLLASSESNKNKKVKTD